MASLVVYGAAGFVAHSLVPKLAKNGYTKMLLVDRNPVESELLQLTEHAGCSIDVRVAGSLAELRDVEDVGAVICLAAATSVDAALENPGPTTHTNLDVALDLAEWLRIRHPTARAVYLSSDEVLGVSRVPLATEAPLRPTQPYAASKAAAEIILHTWRDVYRLDLVTLRSCNLVGHHQHGKKLIPVAVHAISEGRPVPVYGRGTQQREWLAVEDLCDAIIMLLDSKVHPGIYHAASGVHLSVLDVVGLISQALDVQPDAEHVVDRLVDDECYALDPSSLRSTGWRAKHDPREAIRKAALWYAASYAKQADPTLDR